MPSPTRSVPKAVTTRNLESECERFLESMRSKYAEIMDSAECTQSIVDQLTMDEKWKNALNENEREIHGLKQKVTALEMECETAESDSMTMRSVVKAQKERIEADSVNLQDLEKRIRKVVIERNGYREQSAESEEQYQEQLHQATSLKEERDDLMDRISALSLGLQRRTNEFEAMEREIRQKAEHQVLGQRQRLLRLMDIKKAEMVLKFNKDSERMKAHFEHRLKAKHDDLQMMERKLCLQRKLKKESRERDDDKGDEGDSVHYECNLRIHGLRIAKRNAENGLKYWMKQIEIRNKHCRKMSECVGTLRRTLAERVKNLEDAVNFADGIIEEFQSMKEHCRCGSVYGDLQRLKEMERMIKQKNKAFAQCLYYLVGHKKEKQRAEGMMNAEC